MARLRGICSLLPIIVEEGEIPVASGVAPAEPAAAELVFVFETLMNKKMRLMLLQRDVKFDVDSIKGYREISVDTAEGSDYHTLVSEPGSITKGQVLYLTPQELAVLDDWEDQYKRVQVTTESGKKVWVYLLQFSTVVDRGQNVDVALNTDDLSMLDMAIKTGEEVLGKKNPFAGQAASTGV